MPTQLRQGRHVCVQRCSRAGHARRLYLPLQQQLPPPTATPTSDFGSNVQTPAASSETYSNLQNMLRPPQNAEVQPHSNRSSNLTAPTSLQQTGSDLTAPPTSQRSNLTTIERLRPHKESGLTATTLKLPTAGTKKTQETTRRNV